MTEKTSILSFRITPELKTKLETRASLQRKTLTEFVRDSLSDSEGEQVLKSARKEFTELESDARKMDARISALKTQYGEMMETVANSQKGLLSELESRRKRLRSNRWVDIGLMTVLCLFGSFLGFAAVTVIGYTAR
ncbi:type II toxin -antitoxin system TacA 1-like antitoxin [Pectobacterium polaris]|uniref:type II toxin -antitoxin system TacA 1-like antitoxin n=1 Tax=Pectobacterium polaris TaxID=2042057 RepID=UPI0015827ECA|nr:DUF1778 domain-containing protein [Pectobacterium polaris]